jgi:hypothetical protein
MFSFQELLEKKTEIANDIASQAKPTLELWGVTIDNICLKSNTKVMQISPSAKSWSLS